MLKQKKSTQNVATTLERETDYLDMKDNWRGYLVRFHSTSNLTTIIALRDNSARDTDCLKTEDTHTYCDWKCKEAMAVLVTDNIVVQV